MKLDHISVSVLQDIWPNVTKYKVRAELKEVPGKQWQEGLRFVWYNSPYYLGRKIELTIEGSEIELILPDSSDIQNAIDTLSNSIGKADKMVRNTGISYISKYRRVMS